MFEAIMMDILAGLETIEAAIEEIVIAAQGGDWGYGALSTLVGNEALAHGIVNTVAMVFA